MREVKFIQQYGNVSIVSLRDELKLVSSQHTTGIRPGSFVKISDDVLDAGISYGIDWSIVFPDGIRIESDQLQKCFYSQGIFTIEDMKNNPNVVVAAINSVLKLTAINIIKQAKETLGDSGGN